MADREDLNSLIGIMEAEPVVTDAEPELGRIDSLKPLHVALAGGDMTGQSVKDAECGVLVDCVELSLDPVVPNNPLGYVYWPAL